MPEKKKPNEITVDVYGIYWDKEENFLLDSFSDESQEPFPIVCEMFGKYYEIVADHIDKQLNIILTAVAISEPEIYIDEEDFLARSREEGLSIASESFLASPETVIINELEVPAPEAMITGIVRSIWSSHCIEVEDGWDSLFEFQIEIFGVIFNGVFKNMNLTDVKPGNIITCIYYLFGDLLEKEDL